MMDDLAPLFLSLSSFFFIACKAGAKALEDFITRVVSISKNVVGRGCKETLQARAQNWNICSAI